jgi:transposase
MTTGAVIENQRRSLLIYAHRHGISEACRAFRVSRTTFYKLKSQLMKTGSLAPKPRRRPRMPNEIALSKKKILLQLVQEHPNWGPRQYADAFRQHGISVSYVTVWHHLKRFGLNRRFHRLVYLERLRSIDQPSPSGVSRVSGDEPPKLSGDSILDTWWALTPFSSVISKVLAGSIR